MVPAKTMPRNAINVESRNPERNMFLSGILRGNTLMAFLMYGLCWVQSSLESPP